MEFEIPNFVSKARIIHIFAGMHRIGYILPDGRKFVKVSECCHCGECCKRVNCEHLEREPGKIERWRCGLGLQRPYGCCVSEPKDIPGCTSRYKEVK